MKDMERLLMAVQAVLAGGRCSGPRKSWKELGKVYREICSKESQEKYPSWMGSGEVDLIKAQREIRNAQKKLEDEIPCFTHKPEWAERMEALEKKVKELETKGAPPKADPWSLNPMSFASESLVINLQKHAVHFGLGDALGEAMARLMVAGLNNIQEPDPKLHVNVTGLRTVLRGALYDHNKERKGDK